MNPGETALVDRLRREGWAAEPWSNGAGYRYPAHRHGYDKVLVVSAGSISFGLPASDETVELGVGERLDLPSGTDHHAVVGPSGVTCLEAHAAAGTLPRAVRQRGRDW